jgi:predicted phage terminase large subunit-like protein
MLVSHPGKQVAGASGFFGDCGATDQATNPSAGGAEQAASASQPRKSYSPHVPWPKQQAFLDLDCKEAFYGGAAGGGKSDALLMAALQYAHVPGYSALILRKDTRRLELSGGLIPRSHEWLAGSGAKWNGNRRMWTFPTTGRPATLSFGYLLDSLDKYRYGSSEYQYIGFDELTEFTEEDYLFLFSRLRKTVDLNVPLRVRSASNPGNIGHLWVKRRFIGDGAMAAERTSDAVVYWREGRAYIPARIGDNPALNEAEYRDSLAHLPPVVRERLMNGDWSVREEGLIRPEWLRYYTLEGGQLLLERGAGDASATYDANAGERFVTIDPAGTSADRARQRRGRPPSYSVVQAWQHVGDDDHRALVLRQQWRGLLDFDRLRQTIEEAHRWWSPSTLWIENEKLGQALVDLLSRQMPLRCVATQGRDKVARAAALLMRLEKGEIYLPRHAPWLAELESEWLAWTGDHEEPSDQIDAAAYAAAIALDSRPAKLRMLPLFGSR